MHRPKYGPVYVRKAPSVQYLGFDGEQTGGIRSAKLKNVISCCFVSLPRQDILSVARIVIGPLCNTRNTWLLFYYLQDVAENSWATYIASERPCWELIRCFRWWMASPCPVSPPIPTVYRTLLSSVACIVGSISEALTTGADVGLPAAWLNRA